MDDNVLEMRNITKVFPGVRALDDVTLTVRRGETHGLVGENGAGKSTLIKILSGAYPSGSYEGEILVNGKRTEFHSTRDAVRAGIAVIYQELELVNDLSVAENIFLGRLHGKIGVVDWNRVYHEAGALLDSIGQKIDLMKHIGDIGIGQQQMVEIAKALAVNAGILVLDEPTAALTESEVKLLMKILRRLKANGVTCILISHKLNEVLEIADRVTVLRDGGNVGTDTVNSLDEERLIRMMAGRTLTQMFPARNHNVGDVVLEVQSYSKKLGGSGSNRFLRNINLRVHSGEILCIAGLMGAGRTELLMSLFGFLKGESEGAILIHGKRVDITHPRAVIEQGIGMVTEDRKRFGLVPIATVSRNATLASGDQVSKRGIVSEDKEIMLTRRYIEELSIRTPSAKSIVNTLSGGNQQKVLLARSLMTKPKVLLLDEPTRGIDVGAKHEIYTLMNQLASNGTAIVMVSSELPEILGMSDRIIVMHEGGIAGELARDQATQEKVMMLATGGKIA